VIDQAQAVADELTAMTGRRFEVFQVAIPIPTDGLSPERRQVLQVKAAEALTAVVMGELTKHRVLG